MTGLSGEFYEESDMERISYLRWVQQSIVGEGAFPSDPQMAEDEMFERLGELMAEGKLDYTEATDCFADWVRVQRAGQMAETALRLEIEAQAYYPAPYMIEDSQTGYDQSGNWHCARLDQIRWDDV